MKDGRNNSSEADQKKVVPLINVAMIIMPIHVVGRVITAS